MKTWCYPEICVLVDISVMYVEVFENVAVSDVVNTTKRSESLRCFFGRSSVVLTSVTVDSECLSKVERTEKEVLQETRQTTFMRCVYEKTSPPRVT